MFEGTSKLYEQELESQLAETNNKYETLYREEQKIKSELISSKVLNVQYQCYFFLERKNVLGSEIRTNFARKYET